MKFRELAVYLDKLERTSSRIEITKILADLFKKSKENEIDKVVYLSLGILAPSYEGVVFNMAERMMVQVLAKAYEKAAKEVRALYKRLGDLGNVAERLSKKSVTNLSVEEVYKRLRALAEDEGEGSQERKIDKMAKLLSEFDPLSSRFVARIPVGRLRLGFSDKTVLDAMSWMEVGDKSKKESLDQAYEVLPDVGRLARNVRKMGIDKTVAEIKPEVGVPILPMLAQRLKSPTEMIKKMGKVSIEPKLDGLRILIHYKFNKDGFIKAFTRNLNETSWMFPELADAKKYIRAREAIFDTEAIGVDEKRKTLANFQKTMTRRRKHEIEKMASKIPIKFYVFDILLKDGESFLDSPYIERRKILEKTIVPGKVFDLVDYTLTEDPEDIKRINAQKRREGFEGIILKKVNGHYVSGRTGWRWVKMKEAETAQGKLLDTIDCIIMGYTQGRGKRAKFGVGQFLAGVKDNDSIKTVTKVGTGLTDEQFRQLNQRLAKIRTKEKPKEYGVNKDLEPDFWVLPEVVVELAADEITISPKHTAGFALRFPRLVDFRDDKSVSGATTISEIKKLFKLQNH